MVGEPVWTGGQGKHPRKGRVSREASRGKNGRRQDHRAHGAAQSCKGLGQGMVRSC